VCGAENFNQVILSGRISTDPKLHVLLSGCTVCRIGLEVDGVRRNPLTGEWDEKRSFFDVTVFGWRPDRARKVLCRGGRVVVSGRLESRQRESEERELGEAVSVVAENVQAIARGSEEARSDEPVGLW
jgi:single stranded DNA-binding protein